MREVLIHNETKPLAQPLRAGYCNTFFCRLRGLSFRRSLPYNWGLLLVQDRDSRMDASIHMLGMWFDLAIVWINAELEVVDVHYARRWLSFIVPQRAAQYTLEIHPERIEDFQIGDRVRFEEIPGS